MPSPPQPASTRETPWWERELAAEAKNPQLAFSSQIPRLTPDVRGKIRGEAQTAYDYCKGRELFASFHDCGCVAQQFMDKRTQELTEQQRVQDDDIQALDNFIQAWDVNTDSYDSLKAAKEKKFELQKLQRRQKEFFSGNVNQNDLIAMADKVADACPNKAGAADYAYKQCTSMYRHRLQDDVEPFCVCYADRFSESYMREPRASMQNITGNGSAALLSCSKDISPNPLNHQ